VAGEKDGGGTKSSVLKIYSDHVARHLADIRPRRQQKRTDRLGSREAGVHVEGVFAVWTYRITNDNRGPYLLGALAG
jgi:hypothetical protein